MGGDRGGLLATCSGLGRLRCAKHLKIRKFGRSDEISTATDSLCTFATLGAVTVGTVAYHLFLTLQHLPDTKYESKS